MTDERGGRYFREARFFLAGDKVAAQSHILEARSLMGYMRDQLALGGPPIQVKHATLRDGTTIKATMMNGQYQAQIFSPSPSPNPAQRGCYRMFVRAQLPTLLSDRVVGLSEACGASVAGMSPSAFGRHYWQAADGYLLLAQGDVRSLTRDVVVWSSEQDVMTQLTAVVSRFAGFTRYNGKVYVVQQRVVNPALMHYDVFDVTDSGWALVFTSQALSIPSAMPQVVLEFNTSGNVGVAVRTYAAPAAGASPSVLYMLELSVDGVGATQFSGYLTDEANGVFAGTGQRSVIASFLDGEIFIGYVVNQNDGIGVNFELPAPTYNPAGERCLQHYGYVIRAFYRAGFFRDELIVLAYEEYSESKWMFGDMVAGGEWTQTVTHNGYYEWSASGRKNIGGRSDAAVILPSNPHCRWSSQSTTNPANLLDVHFQSRAYTSIRLTNLVTTTFACNIPRPDGLKYGWQASSLSVVYRVGDTEVIHYTAPISPVTGIGVMATWLDLTPIVGRIQGVPYCAGEDQTQLRAVFFGSTAYTQTSAGLAQLIPSAPDNITLVCDGVGATDITPLVFDGGGTSYTDFGVF